MQPQTVTLVCIAVPFAVLSVRPEETLVMAGGAMRVTIIHRRAKRGQSRGRRDHVSVALVVIGGLLLNLSALCLWTWRTFASSQGFADVATDMLKEPAVRQLVARQMVAALEDQELAGAGDMVVAARPLIEQVVEQVVATTAFQGIFHSGVEQVHAAVFAGHRTRLLVPVDDAVQLVSDALRVISPTLADAIPDTALTVAVGITQSVWVERAMSVASIAGWVAGPLALAGMACFAASVRKSSDRRRAVEWVGLFMFASGVCLFTLLFLALQLVASNGDDPVHRTALRAVFWSVTHLLNIEGKVLIIAGAVLWVSAANAAPGEIRGRAASMLERARARLANPGWRLLACLLLIGLAMFAMAWPAASGAILVRVLAFGLFVAGAVGLLDLFGWYQQLVEADAAPHRRRLPVLAAQSLASVVLVPVMLVASTLVVTRATRPASAASPRPDQVGCNGSVELCDKRLDQVAFAGSHNAMSSTAAHFAEANQTRGLLAQLGSGIRALLVDFHYGWTPTPSGVVRTDLLSDPYGVDPADLTPDQWATVIRFMGLLGAVAPPGKRDVFLCHVICERGATRARAGLEEIASFLRENPNEVVLILVEDHVEVNDAVRAFTKSGLASRAWSWQPGTPLPTLRQMIESRHNVLVMAENGVGGDAAPWYHAAFDGLLVETKYHFDNYAEIEEPSSCATVDGQQPSARLFLVNHWITRNGAPSRDDAQTLNDDAELAKRTADCHERVPHFPNIVAVDFQADGDLKAVVSRLNTNGRAMAEDVGSHRPGGP